MQNKDSQDKPGAGASPANRKPTNRKRASQPASGQRTSRTEPLSKTGANRVARPQQSGATVKAAGKTGALNKPSSKKPAAKRAPQQKPVPKTADANALTSKVDMIKQAIPAVVSQKVPSSREGAKKETQPVVHARTVPSESKKAFPQKAARPQGPLPAGKGVGPSNVAALPLGKGIDAVAQSERASKKKLVVIAIVVGVLLLVYLIGALNYTSRFVPNSKLGAFDISHKTSAEVEAMLDDALNDYTLAILGDGFSFTASGADTGLTVDYEASMKAIHDDLNGWAWPLLLITGVHDETSKIVTTSGTDSAALEKLGSAIDAFNETATPPTNASLSYVQDKNDFFLLAETIGTQLDKTAVTDAAANAMVNLKPTLTLDQSYLLQPTIKASDPRVTSALKNADTIIESNIDLTFNNVTVGTIDGATLAPMVAFDADANASLDQNLLNTWVTALAKKVNTAGSTRTYKRADGVDISVAGGVYGWEIDAKATCEAITAAAKEGLNGSIAIPCLSEGATYTAAGQRDWGTRYLDVDISEQHVRFYGDNGSVIWEADCITGKPDGTRDTVKGVWYVTDKESPYTLVGYTGNQADYESHVTYWMPFEGNSIGFHDATWQWAGFGGELYAEGFGSHGCVNLSYSDAQALYNLISIRDVVVVHE